MPDTLIFAHDGRTSNNCWPVIIYRTVYDDTAQPTAAALEARLRANGWPPQWRGGVFDFHHYHSNAHESLAVTHRQATLRRGGEAGRDVDVAIGDMVIRPAPATAASPPIRIFCWWALIPRARAIGIGVAAATSIS